MLGRKIACVTAREPFDKRRDIDVLYTPSILCGYGDSAFIGNAKLTPVAVNVIVYSRGNRVEQGRFSRIPTAGNNGNTLSDSHSAHTANFNFIIGCGLKRNRARHRQACPFCARQNTAICNEGAIVTAFQPFSDRRLFFRKRGGVLQSLPVEIQNKTIDRVGKVTAKHLYRLAELPFRQLHLNEKAKTHKRRSGNVVTKQIDLRTRAVLIILLRTKSKIR